jgi:protease-4
MNTQTQKSFLRKLIEFIPNTLVKLANFTRHFILLIILFFLVKILFFNDKVELKRNTALVIAPTGMVVNQFSGTPSEKFIKQLQGSDVPETQLRDLVKAIEKATTDERISVLVLSPDLMWGIGLADLKELENAIAKFREVSKKPIIALAENMSQNQYYFANLADEIILDPQAFMFFQGYGSYRNYFKDGLDKLGVDVHLFRVGEYKSAAEPYIRNDMSIEAKEASLHYMNDLWKTYTQGIVDKRNVSIDDFNKIIADQATLLKDSSGDMASMYKKAGLIDQIKNQHFKEKYIAELSATDDDNNGFRNIGLIDYLTVIDQEKSLPKPNKVAIIVAEGTILNGEQDAGNIGGVSTSKLLRKARLDKSIKAVVLRVNSGGGAVFASEQIRREVDAIKIAGKPVVVSMGNVAASGGYWISMTADKIYASDATITGSIGIFGMFMTYPKTLAKIGVHTDGVGTSDWAGAFRPDRELNENLAELIQSNIDHGYQQFISSVAMARNMDIELVDSIARGRVWTAKQAKEFGLIDEIGTLSDAIADAANKASVGNDFDLVWIEPELTVTQQFLMSTLAQVSDKFDIDLMPKQHKLLEKILSPIEKSLELVTHAKQGELTQYAHCLCDIIQ